MKHDFGKRALALVLSLALWLGLLPAQALAGSGGTLYFAASDGKTLIVPPEKIRYAAGATVRQALAESGHTLLGLEQDQVLSIDGVSGNYIRSDENGGYDLDRSADEIDFFCFDVREGFLTGGRQALIRAMADLAEEESDVRAAAGEAYQAALEAYSTADDAALAALAQGITDAADDYQSSLRETYAVTFTGAEAGAALTAENPYGRSFSDEDGDGVLALPRGSYTFTLAKEGSRVDGGITVAGEMTVGASLPEGEWMDVESARLSMSSGAGFEESELALTRTGRTFTAVVPDTYATGGYCLYAEYNTELFDESSRPDLYACYTRTDGSVISPETAYASSKRVWSSKNSSVKGVTAAGSGRGEIVYRASQEREDGFTYSVEYTFILERSLSLSALSVTDQDGTGQGATELFSPEVREYTYRVLSSVSEVSLKPTAFQSGYAVTVNGTPLRALSAIPLNAEGETVVTIALSSGGARGEYQLTFVRAEGQKITFETDSETGLAVYNQNGEEMLTVKTKEGTSNLYSYTLVPGERYHYIATRDTYYHATAEFTLEEMAGSRIRVTVPTEDALGTLELSANTGFSSLYELDQTVRPETHSYTVRMSDRNSRLAIRAAALESAQTGTEAEVLYTTVAETASKHGKSQSAALGTRGKQLQNAVMANAAGNTLTLRFSYESNNVTYYQDYTVEIQRELSLGALTASYGGSTLLLEPAYTPEQTEYAVTVPMGAVSMELDAALRSGVAIPFGAEGDGYWVEINGERASGVTAVALSGDAAEEEIGITVGSELSSSRREIRLTVHKAAPVTVRAALTPAEGLLVLTDCGTGSRIWPGSDGSYELCEGFSYDWQLTARGYVGRGGTISVETDESGVPMLVLAGEEPVIGSAESAGIDWTLALSKAEENPALDPTIEAEWADFRGTSYRYDPETQTVTSGGTQYTNNGITDVRTPVESQDTDLYWAVKLGEGYGANAVGCPILVGGDLITFSGNQIYRVDSVSGEVLAKGTMAGGSNFAINNSTYYGGMIFVGLSEGRVQAFDAKTLESLWIFQDKLGGQPNCPITVYDGYLYTGFWQGEEVETSFVCVSITDEDPSCSDEKKLPAWTVTRKGGFYWAGAYVCQDFVLVGTDDGQSGYVNAAGTGPNRTSALLMLDPRTGALLDSREGLGSDIRSAVSYDAESDAYYFTSKGGYFYRARVGKNDDGEWRITQLDELALSNGGSDAKNPAMSTCTPVIHNGRAYIGVSGVGQFKAWSGHNITVIDLDHFRIAYSVPTHGYPQTSGLLTTAYEDATGYVYVYFFDNMTPGKLRVLRDKKGQKSPEYTTEEQYSESGETQTFQSPYVLFTPVGDQAQYAICSPIVDSYGTIYFKNDSAHLMAFGSAVKTLEITQQPAKTVYAAGECFDPEGMTVIAHYYNGASRDVTRYLTYSTEPLEQGETGVTLTFPYVMYHNADEGQSSQAGISGTKPYVTLAITVTEAAPEVEVAWTAGTVRVAAEKDAARCVAAVYDAEGRLLSTAGAALSDGGVTLSLTELDRGALVKVFYLDETSSPVREAVCVPHE